MDVQVKAREMHRYETVRDCDYYLAVYGRHAEVFYKLYFGTPYESYRKRLTTAWGESNLPEAYEWNLNNAPYERVVAEGDQLKTGHGMQRLFVALCSDFYKPIRVAQLQALLFEDERYHPDRTPRKIQLIARRLRTWFGQQKIPVTVEAIPNEGYFLKATKPCAVLVHRQDLTSTDFLDSTLFKLKEQFSKPFSVSEARKLLKISTSYALKTLRRATQDGLVQRTGMGKATRYCFPSEIRKDAA